MSTAVNPVIYFDVHGVICFGRQSSSLSMKGVDREKVELLIKLSQRTRTKLVLASTGLRQWADTEALDFLSLLGIADHLMKESWKAPLFGNQSADYSEGNKPREIETHAHNNNVPYYIGIDDKPFFTNDHKGEFVLATPFGLTADIAEKCEVALRRRALLVDPNRNMHTLPLIDLEPYC